MARTKAISIVASAVILAIAAYFIFEKRVTTQSRVIVPSEPGGISNFPTFFLAIVYNHDQVQMRTKEGERPLIAVDAACWRKVDGQSAQSNFWLRKADLTFVKPWFLARDPGIVLPDDEGTKEGRFFLGLARGGFIQRYNKQKDDVKALKLFRQVADEDPSNAAPWLYAAMVAPSGQQAALLEKARAASKFDSYLVKFANSLFSRVATPADLVQAELAWQMISTPDQSVYKFMKEQKDLSSVARLMTASAINAKFATDFEWVPDEYQTGRSLMGQGEAPEFRFLFKQALEAPVSAWRMTAELVKTCDLATLAPMVESLRNSMKNKPL